MEVWVEGDASSGFLAEDDLNSLIDKRVKLDLTDLEDRLQRQIDFLEDTKMHKNDDGKLSKDTYTLMMLSEPVSLSWLLGFLAYFFQVTLGSMIIVDQIQYSLGSDVFLAAPTRVSMPVRIGQFLSIILCLSKQDDMLAAMQIIVAFRFKFMNVWAKVIDKQHEGGPDKTKWFVRIIIPQSMKFSQGLIVLTASLIIICQSNNLTSLLKGLTAYFVLSSVDNFLTELAEMGYLGKYLEQKGISARNVLYEDCNAGNNFIFRRAVFLFLLVLMISGWVYIVVGQTTLRFMADKYPDCVKELGDLSPMGNGTCEWAYNIRECGFDDGDCKGSPIYFANCKVDRQVLLMNGACDGGVYNTKACEFDGGDCTAFNRDFPNCTVTDPFRVGDGTCNDDDEYNIKACGFDGGDCSN